MHQILVGALVGLLYQLFSYPFDTIKTNIQSGEKNFLELMKNKFWLQKSFRRGFMIACLKDILMTPIYLTVYENMKH